MGATSSTSSARCELHDALLCLCRHPCPAAMDSIFPGIRFHHLLQEFPLRSREYYQQAFADGRLRVEATRRTIAADTPLYAGERMRHFIHRHEPPVLDTEIQVW